MTSAFYGTTTPSPTSNPPIAAQDVDEYALSNGKTEIKIITLGGTITEVNLGKGSKAANVTLAFKSLEDYETKNGGPLTPAPHTGPYFGSLIGRFGNRIAGGEFTLNGQTYCLDVNNGPNHLHGGVTGFNAVVWDVTEVIETPDEVGIALHYLSRAGEGWNPTENNNADCIAAGGSCGLSRKPRRQRDVHAEQKGRAAHPVLGNHGCANDHQPHQSRLLEHARRGNRHDLRPAPVAECE